MINYLLSWTNSLCLRVAAFSTLLGNAFVLFSRGMPEEKNKRERSNDHLNEFAGHKWFIVQRKKGGKGERPHFKAFLLFPKWGWKSAAWLSPNKWLLLPFHGAQRPNPRTTWATNVDSDWDHHSMCQTLLSTHKNTLTAALWSENGPERENVKEVSTVISPKERLQHLGI